MTESTASWPTTAPCSSPGKAHQIQPHGGMDRVGRQAPGRHPGSGSGSRCSPCWSVNKSKSYRRPRSNVALLSGLLVCGNCGDYMRPKLTNRHTANGETDLYLPVLYQGAQPELSLPDEKRQRQHAGCKGDFRNQKTVRIPELLCRLPGSNEEGHQRQSGGIRRRAADTERKTG